MITNIPELIRKARGRRSQAEFAKFLGVSQSTLCRYESGEVNPRAEVIEQCMHLVHGNDDDQGSSIEELVAKVRGRLGRADQAPLRTALSKLIDGLAV
ncbi:helix-turn-helix transcriptional regulator [Azospira sp. I13]|uniref:helix-turn-helix domain-containing protein n=1 Tax=Azospira sp. I13 TaxID=1765050 RepID=UPI001403579E|nr:helix-turn-helix transcriptional regulator [Azospira sp. I13]